jgi:hypothetical protein
LGHLFENSTDRNGENLELKNSGKFKPRSSKLWGLIDRERLKTAEHRFPLPDFLSSRLLSRPRFGFLPPN